MKTNLINDSSIDDNHNNTLMESFNLTHSQFTANDMANLSQMKYVKVLQ